MVRGVWHAAPCDAKERSWARESAVMQGAREAAPPGRVAELRRRTCGRLERADDELLRHHCSREARWLYELPIRRLPRCRVPLATKPRRGTTLFHGIPTVHTPPLHSPIASGVALVASEIAQGAPSAERGAPARPLLGGVGARPRAGQPTPEGAVPGSPARGAPPAPGAARTSPPSGILTPTPRPSRSAKTSTLTQTAKKPAWPKVRHAAARDQR